MTIRLGVSGSTILSDPEKFHQLFWEGIDHIEIGELPDEKALAFILDLCRSHQVSFGVHSPLYRNQSKYDLLQKVHFEPEQAWDQLEHEMIRLKRWGAEYVLVHFPYFKQAVMGSVNDDIKNGIVRIKQLQECYSLPVICEPKLGWNKSPVGIQYFQESSIQYWENIGICIDLGDFLMATGDKVFDYLNKWEQHIRVVHLHNVEFVENDKYWWIPVHPSHEADGVHYKMAELIHYLSRLPNVTFVFEHTPHSQPDEEWVKEGYQWVKQLIMN